MVDRMDFVDRTGALAKTPEIIDQFFAKVPAGKPFFFVGEFLRPASPLGEPGNA